MTDQYREEHYLPFFLCKVTNPDQSMIKFDEEKKPVRGVRTLAEIAHYVRCIPYQTREGLGANENKLWTSPDFTGIIKVGSEDDHALLMASIFRTCKLETFEKYQEFVKKESDKLVSKNADDEALLNVDEKETKTAAEDKTD